MVGDIRRGLTDLFSLPDGYEVLLGLGGSTLFWDAASFGLVDQRSTHVVIGEFSSKFAEATRAAPHLGDPQVCETAPGETPALPRHDRRRRVRIPPQRDVDRRDRSPCTVPRRDALVVVDGTSAAGGMRVDRPRSTSYYFAPQKCFASDGGLWLALCSPRGDRTHREDQGDEMDAGCARPLDRDRELAPRTDLQHARPSRRCFSSTGSCAGCSTTVAWSSRPDVAIARLRSSTTGPTRPSIRDCRTSRILRLAAASPPRSTSTNGSTRAQLASALRANGIVDVEPYRKLGRNQLRIALFPAIEPDDVRTLTRAIDFLVERVAV